MFKSLTIAVATAAMAIGVSGEAVAAAKQLKFAIFTPTKEPTFGSVMVPFAEGASKDSGGTIKIDVFPGGTLGKNPRAQLKLTLDGVVDMSWIVNSYTAGRFPDNSVFELPGMFANVNEAANTSWRLLEKGMLRGYDDIFVVGMFQTHPYFIHTKPKVSSLADLRGLKIRAAGPVYGAAIKALGAAAVGMPAPAIAENISRGVIDGAALEMNGHYAFRTKDTAKHTLVSSTGGALLGTASLSIVMNKIVYDGLPEQARKAILKNRGQNLTDRFVKLHTEKTKRLMGATIKNPDLTVTRLSAEDQKIFDQKMAGVVNAWASKHDRGTELLAAVRAEVSAIRSGK